MGEDRCEVCGTTSRKVRVYRGEALCPDCQERVDEYAKKHPWFTYAECVRRVRRGNG